MARQGLTGPNPDTISVRVPIAFGRRGGRKVVMMPEGAEQRATDNTLVKALARAFRWKRKLESGSYASISELAEREGIAFTYMARLMRLSLLCPEIVVAIMDGREPASVSLANLIGSFPLSWEKQSAQWIHDSDSGKRG